MGPRRVPVPMFSSTHYVPEASLGPSPVGMETNSLMELTDWRRRQKTNQKSQVNSLFKAGGRSSKRYKRVKWGAYEEVQNRKPTLDHVSQKLKPELKEAGGVKDLGVVLTGLADALAVVQEAREGPVA